MMNSASMFWVLALDIQRPIDEDKRLVQRCAIDLLRLGSKNRSGTYIDGETSFAIRFTFIACKAGLSIVKSLVYGFSFSSINGIFKVSLVESFCIGKCHSLVDFGMA